MAEKRRCENCGKAMKQQFIGLKHCKCGTSWQKGVGYFQRTNDMVFALERKVTKKGKNSIRTKQVPVVRYKPENQDIIDVIEQGDTLCALTANQCRACKGDKQTVDGCQPFLYNAGGKKYARIKVGDASDMYEGSGAVCTDCGAKRGYPHHVCCDCETCPMCGGQLFSCRCGLFDTPS